MRTKPWMAVRKARDPWAEDYEYHLADTGSHKGARRLRKRSEIYWRRNHKELLDDLYRKLSPGSRVCTCLHGHILVERIEVEVSTSRRSLGQILGLRVCPPKGREQYAPCQWGSCVSPGWDCCGPEDVDDSGG